ncbi:gene transfer agent family protein [Aurantimonas sp. 22II-16-19i]|uniref:gene transfer agent family protein n=1 Tax=Aurantimonas sp. 22II-16-19i TaxID=1317114 RepID=UPI0009F7C5C8|nr:gene transfer agent family protein [Aurantimonas sp. 22II-16-19i]ORE90144.1 hypothetical protein ATO4_22017 [Aurantimonas sp. 22II-16-19i]
MNPVRQFFGDAERDFALSETLVVEIERKAGVGIGSFWKRLMSGDYFLADPFEVVRLALVGGGTDPQEAKALVETYARPRPVQETVLLALEILGTFLVGVDSEEAGA